MSFTNWVLQFWFGIFAFLSQFNRWCHLFDHLMKAAFLVSFCVHCRRRCASYAQTKHWQRWRGSSRCKATLWAIVRKPVRCQCRYRPPYNQDYCIFRCKCSSDHSVQYCVLHFTFDGLGFLYRRRRKAWWLPASPCDNYTTQCSSRWTFNEWEGLGWEYCRWRRCNAYGLCCKSLVIVLTIGYRDCFFRLPAQSLTSVYGQVIRSQSTFWVKVSVAPL